jgi:hypothetical protein
MHSEQNCKNEPVSFAMSICMQLTQELLNTSLKCDVQQSDWSLLTYSNFVKEGPQ